MCGIYGVIDYNGSISIDTKIQKTQMLYHRGPDNIGFFCENNLFLGHARLSILDLADTANQPFQDTNYCLIFNGEIYNYLSLKKKFFNGIHFRTTSDTEVLFELLKSKTDACLPLLNGMFAFAFYDKSKKQLLLGRDITGIKPVYYINQPDLFEFSSEIKNLSYTLNTDTLQEVVLRGGYQEGNSPYGNIQELLPGYSLKIDFNNRQIRVEPFACLNDFINRDRFRELSQKNNLVDNLDELLQESVALHLQSDAPLGSLCSGGVDSSLISALALKHNKDVKLYHAGVQGSGGEEMYAQMVSDHLHIPIEYIKMKREEYWHAFPLVTFHNDLPVYHPNDVSLYSIAQKAHSDGIKVLLSGEGADELFGGYPWHQYFASTLKKYTREFIKTGFLYRIKNKLMRTIFYKNGMADFGVDDFINFSAMGIGYAPQSIERTYCGGALTAQKFKLWKRWMENLKSYKDIATKYESAVLSFILNNMYGHLGTILHRTDRILMSHSIEGRVPFLENTLLEFALNLPLCQKIRGKEGKAILKKVALRYLPPKVVYRKKEGFPVPWESYLPTDLTLLKNGFFSDWTNLSLRDLKPWYSNNPIRKFRLISIEVWGRIFIWNEKPEDIKVE